MARGDPCPCGSGQPCWLMTDARGIPCGYVCVKCEDEKRAGYRSDIFTNPDYEADEDIEPEGDDSWGDMTWGRDW